MLTAIGHEKGDDDFGDDFDEFEEGENNVEAEDDFGDFDEGFEEPPEETHGNRTVDTTVPLQSPAAASLVRLRPAPVLCCRLSQYLYGEAASTRF